MIKMKKIMIITTLLTMMFLLIGFFLGVWFDNLRADELREELTEIDIMWNDARLQSLYYQTFSDGELCDSALEGNLKFSERIYEEGQKIERYEKVNRFAPNLLSQKKRYALLQMQFWFNSISLRERCGYNYSTVVYLYSHYDDELSTEQKVMSAALFELKEEHGSDMMLIPLPADIGILSVDVIEEEFGVKELPAIIVNEKHVFEGMINKDQVEEVLFER